MGLDYLIQGKVNYIDERPPNDDQFELTILTIRAYDGLEHKISMTRHGFDFLLGQEVSVFRTIVDYKKDIVIVDQVIKYYDSQGHTFTRQEFQERLKFLLLLINCLKTKK